MDETLATNSTTPESSPKAEAKGHFARALDEAKAGAQALGREAQERADLYREKISSSGGDLSEQAKEWTGQAKERAAGLASDGKAKASEAIAGLGKVVADNATLIDEKVGAKYGDYARSAAQSLQDAATRLDAKDLDELTEDAKEFVRKSPGVAIGAAAVAGFLLARLFRGSSN